MNSTSRIGTSKKILIVAPQATSGQPVAERTKAFVDFFKRHGIETEKYRSPTTFTELLALIYYIYIAKYRTVFITMPPFRNWSLCLLPGIKTILDLRDGWSIAMHTGYGGTVRPAHCKALIARMIEQIAIWRSALAITCTPGLMSYHTTWLTRKRMLLILNGFPDHEFQIAQKARLDAKKVKRPSDELVFVCAGKFSEYGHDKAKCIINMISKNFRNYKCTLSIYSSIEDNIWIKDYMNTEGISNINVKIIGYIDRKELLYKIAAADYGIVVLRDSKYEIGTKVFDYIVCGVKLFGCFSREFWEVLGDLQDRQLRIEEALRFSRSSILEEAREKILTVIK